MVSIPGVDYAWAPHPSPAALRAAGTRFAARYSSTDPSKDLTRDEANALAAEGIWSVLVRESAAKRAAAGRAAGATDAQAALRTADACGMPTSRPLYFAVDFDAEPTTVAAYFQGVASVIGVARTGVYGGYRVVKYLLDHGLVAWAWQTTAWSAGRWDPRAHIRQGATQTIGGADCDLNTALTADYGQWMPGKTPQEDDMLTAADYKAIAAEVVREITAPAVRDTLANAGLYWWERVLDLSIPIPTGADAPPAARSVAALRPVVAEALAHPESPQLTDAQVGQIATTLAADSGFADKLAEAVADKLAARLQS